MSDLLPSVRSVLATTGARWAALATIDPELLARAPAPGEWSAIQCLQHVVDTEHAVFRARVLAILDGRDLAAYDPDVEGSVDRIVQRAAESLETLEALEAADLDHTARRRTLGSRASGSCSTNRPPTTRCTWSRPSAP
jgi:hypothetical protein